MIKRILLFVCVSFLFTIAGFAQGGTTATAPVATPAATPKTGGSGSGGGKIGGGGVSEKSSKPPIFRPTKDQIKQVQSMLKGKKLYSGEATGSYNDETRSGIKSFQKDNGLKETGTLNRATLEKMNIELTDSQKAIPVSENSFAAKESSKTEKTASTSSVSGTKKPAPFRANTDQINAAQKLLKNGKMYAGEETGKLDDPTRESLKKFQEANNLKVTGTLNAATLEKMGITLTDAQKANVAAAAAYEAGKNK